MYPYLQTEKNRSNFAKDITKNRFVQTLMTYISLNIEVVTERVTKNVEYFQKKKRKVLI